MIDNCCMHKSYSPELCSCQCHVGSTTNNVTLLTPPTPPQMELRDWFAGMALMGSMANDGIQKDKQLALDAALGTDELTDENLSDKWEASWAYSIADAMMEARKKKK